MKILVMGLPSSGKTTFATALARELSCVHFNADEIRKEINKDLGFSVADRIEQARRMGVLCDIASRYGAHVIADFVCPTPETREAFGAHFIVWVDRIKEGPFEDTNKLFVPPENHDVRVDGKFGMQYYAEEIAKIIAPKKKKFAF
jgi:adenylylsulfate kinase